MYFGKRMTEIVHEMLESYVGEGDVALDATMGKGNDTLKLCELVGESGHVYGFDIQSEAISQTKALLEAHDMVNRADLILDSHEHLSNYIQEALSAFVFNLGYLPEGDHGIITKSDSTIKAIQDGLSLLKSGGIGLILVYYGHEGGSEEKLAVEALLKGLRVKQYDVLKLENHNRNHTPPILYMIKKN